MKVWGLRNKIQAKRDAGMRESRYEGLSVEVWGSIDERQGMRVEGRGMKGWVLLAFLKTYIKQATDRIGKSKNIDINTNIVGFSRFQSGFLDTN